jgi:phenylacetate-CoA ligase
VRRYWNDEIETMAPAALRRLEDTRLAEQIAYNWARSPFYRAKLEGAGLRPDTVRRVEDLAAIPFTEKSELAQSQLEGALLGANQCAELADIVRVQATGGTTGQPLRIGLTRRDAADYGEMGARALWAMGCRPTDIVFECMNYHLYAGGLSDHMTFETLGAATIPFGVGHTEKLVRMMASIAADLSIWATPSYGLRLAESAREHGLDPRALRLRKGFFSGEAGLQVPGYRRRIEDEWNMVAQDMYGTGELGLHSGECEHRAGVHYGGSGFCVVELIDPETGAVKPFEDGAQGEAVYTSIRREACPLQRMRSHDLMQVFTERCACGRATFRFRVLGRSDDMFIVKGVNVFPLAVQATLAALAPRATGEFQITLDRPPPIDYAVPIAVEVAREISPAAYDSFRREIADAIKRHNNFAAEIRLVAQGSLARTERKTRRLVRAYKGETA